MDEIKAKQQVVEKIKEASKILVTVSDNPSVDALSAALGLALILDKQEKYSTAIFSGETPPAIAFLEPQKTFDDTTDSLRDFIIALNKEKADHLRYKVEGDSVRIFITPYKTTINQDDLEFSQGDYNVELVIALGVDNQEHLDKALENHGQILHDAAIITLTSGDQTSDLGGIDWHDANSSSLSEMVAGLAEALKEDKKKSLLDTPIATALLTGIVAETDRFSNEHTTSKVMTVAASLMAAGADQQLIATELQQAREIDAYAPEVEEDTSSNDEDDDSNETPSGDDGMITIKKDATSLSIAHDDETLAELDERIRGEEAAQDKIEDEIEAVEEEAEIAAEKHEKEVIEHAKPKIDEQPSVVHGYVSEEDVVDEPTFGGTLNATAGQAEDDTRRALEEDQNKTILSHSYIGDASVSAPAETPQEPVGFPGTPPVAPGSIGVNNEPSEEAVHSAYSIEEPTQAEPSVAFGGERVIQPLAPAEPVAPVTPLVPEIPSPDPVSAYAFSPEPVQAPAFEPVAPVVGPTAYAPAPPVDLGLPLPPPIPDFSQGLAAPTPAEAPQFPQQPQPAILGDILAPEPANASGLDYEATNTIPAPGTAYAFEAPAADPNVQPLPPAPSQPPAPGQFQIPGQ